MKLYIKTRNKFLIISLIIFIISVITIFILKNSVLGNFLLGVLASTLIIAIEANTSSKVRESELLIDKLKTMMICCLKFYDYKTFSIESFTLGFERKYKETKENLDMLFKLNNELICIGDLTRKTKEKLIEITSIISGLEMSLYIIFKNYDNQNDKFKTLYFIEFYKIINKFDFEMLSEKIADLGWDIDSKEFSTSDAKKEIENRIRKLEYATSIDVFNKKVEENNITEYKALKDKFDKDF